MVQSVKLWPCPARRAGRAGEAREAGEAGEARDGGTERVNLNGERQRAITVRGA